MIKYESTRNCEEAVSAHEAVIHGLAKDGGLYTPAKITGHIDPKEILKDIFLLEKDSKKQTKAIRKLTE